MYLSEMTIRNFRCFDASDSNVLHFRRGLNVLVGENDSGKSTVIDAIRTVMGTTDQSWNRISIMDFHNEDDSKDISISLKFENLNEDERAAFVECLDDENGSPVLHYNWTCSRLRGYATPRYSVRVSTGSTANGPSPEGSARELLRVTYLKPLRNAAQDMQSGRNSRLSNILRSFYGNDGGNKNLKDIYEEGDSKETLSLIGIADMSDKLVSANPFVEDSNSKVSTILNGEMLLSGEAVETKISVSGTLTRERRLQAMLEKLDLDTVDRYGEVGLGTSNLLSMACELLLNRDITRSTFLLVEEPEAHIHAQRQLRLIQSLERAVSSEKDGNADSQVIITTHSPLMSSVISLENISIVRNGRMYSLAKGYTKLEEDDYRFLERFLDATKANLFFAKAVMLVEGPSEELLIPTIARIIGRDFTKYGVSIVNVNGVGFRHYVGIFKRRNDKEDLGIPVACVTDRDAIPDKALEIIFEDVNKLTTRRLPFESETEKVEKNINARTKGIADNRNVKVFVSPHWTLEYDLSLEGLADEFMEAIRKIRPNAFSTLIYSSEEEKCIHIQKKFVTDGVSKAEVAQYLADILIERFSDKPDELKAKLPKYITDAIYHVTGGVSESS